MPWIKITDEERQTIDTKYFCISCKFLLHIPMQTMCGHLMCQSCVENLLKSSSSKCPEDGEELTRETVFPDAFTRRELKGIHLHCPNPGCSWHSTYDQLEGHCQVCEHALIKCSNSRCQVKLKRSYLGEHLKGECEYRDVKCDYCQQDVAYALMKEHVKSICEGAPVTCKYCRENVVKKDLKGHEKDDCNEAPATCDFRAIGCSQDKTLKRKELRQHSNDGLINHVWLLLQYVLASVSQLGNHIPRPEFIEVMQKIRDDISDVRSGLAEKFVMLVGKLTGLERRIETLESSCGSDARIKTEMHEVKTKLIDRTSEQDNLRERIMSLERELRDKISIIDRLQGRMDQNDEVVALNTVKITDMESQRGTRAHQSIIHSYNGTLLWKIEGYQRKRQDAINGVKTALYSPSFYSAQFGYKVCAKIYMNGDGFGKGSHLSLFFVVMRGDYDALQTWPFQKKITMMLLDQSNGDHMIDAFHSDPQSSSFQRPKSDMNIASGSPLFMPLDSLNNRQYIKDDVMFVKIIVD